jgi:hypothetical protein
MIPQSSSVPESVLKRFSGSHERAEQAIEGVMEERTLMEVWATEQITKDKSHDLRRGPFKIDELPPSMRQAGARSLAIAFLEATA